MKLTVNPIGILINEAYTIFRNETKRNQARYNKTEEIMQIYFVIR